MPVDAKIAEEHYERILGGVQIEVLSGLYRFCYPKT